MASHPEFAVHLARTLKRPEPRRPFSLWTHIVVFTCLLLFISTDATRAQSQDASPKIKPERVLLAYEHAVGLTELAHLQNVHIKGQMRPLSPGPVQDFDGVYAVDGRMRELTSTREDSLLASDHSDGFDGKEYWSSDTEKRKPGIVFWQQHSKATRHHPPFQSYFFPFEVGWRTNPEHHFSLLGLAMVKDRKAIVIKDERDETYSIYYHFDAESFLLLRLDSVSKRQTAGKSPSKPYVVTIFFSNYKPLGALQIPRTIRMDEQFEISVDAVETNVSFADRNYNRP